MLTLDIISRLSVGKPADALADLIVSLTGVETKGEVTPTTFMCDTTVFDEKRGSKDINTIYPYILCDKGGELQENPAKCVVTLTENGWGCVSLQAVSLRGAIEDLKKYCKQGVFVSESTYTKLFDSIPEEGVFTLSHNDIVGKQDNVRRFTAPLLINFEKVDNEYEINIVYEVYKLD